jgi:diaminopimelate epimerase
MRLTKHQGLGNDFLVLLDLNGVHAISRDLARAACDRHRGIGADGLLHVTAGAGAADVTMALYNADGSRAEMSGNGVRCLGQAVLQAEIHSGPRLRVATDAGLRTLEIKPTEEADTHLVTVDMGPADDQGDAPDWVGHGVVAAAWASMGNPHLVLYAPEPDQAPDVVEVGHIVNDRTAGGANVEVIAVGPGTDEIVLEVYERGVGPTLACGTGACAAAAVAHRWGLVDREVRVRMPGGTAYVTLTDDTILLGGPTTSIGLIEYPWPVRDRLA